ncbi:MAG: anti-sigma F factor [Clostridia bacterium]|nr:anti-sigma F factor [Clostridia bacterium]
MKDIFELTINADSKNEAFARATVAAYSLALSPTLEEIGDLKTATSEAVTNAVVHAYGKDGGKIVVTGELDKEDNSITVTVRDFGCGIEDLPSALEPFYTTKPDEERSGMGFTIIDTFTDEMHVESTVNVGTIVRFKKVFKNAES